MNRLLFVLSFFFILSILFQCRNLKTIKKQSSENVFNVEYNENQSVMFSSSGDAYYLMGLRGYLGANNSKIQTNGENSVIEYQMRLIENLISTAVESKNIKNNKSPYKDSYRGWTSKKDNLTLNTEVPLYESYSFFYVVQFLYYTKSNGWYDESNQNKKRWNNILVFIETNIWTKWFERSLLVKGNHYWYFLRGRTHMGSHWAGMAMYLNALTGSTEIKSQTEQLIEQYDTLLKRNLREIDGAYIWNSTYDNVEGTNATAVPENIVQDVSHGNHVVSYIVAAHEFGNKNWTLDDITKLNYTIKNFMYDKKNNRFYDRVDGSSDKNRPGWGNFVADGWVKLADYDSGVRRIFTEFEKTKMLKKYSQELQFKANLYK